MAILQANLGLKMCTTAQMNQFALFAGVRAVGQHDANVESCRMADNILLRAEFAPAAYCTSLSHALRFGGVCTVHEILK
jgi:hypothetical protein